LNPVSRPPASTKLNGGKSSVVMKRMPVTAPGAGRGARAAGSCRVGIAAGCAIAPVAAVIKTTTNAARSLETRRKEGSASRFAMRAISAGRIACLLPTAPLGQQECDDEEDRPERQRGICEVEDEQRPVGDMEVEEVDHVPVDEGVDDVADRPAYD